MQNKKYIMYLHSCGCSQGELTKICKIEASIQDFFENVSDSKFLKYIANTQRRQGILDYYRKIDTQEIDNIIEKLGVQLICLGDTEYPETLKNIPHTPYILYVRGKLPKEDMFGVVGSRKVSSYGKKVISKIVPDISRIFPIVSGGAAGCDTEAHRAALDSESRTVVVVGTGIDKTYPITNTKLFDKIVKSGGAIVSIFRVGEPGNPYNFPVRNEIVVGLSRGILVVEAQKRSGSLITAGLCLDLGKDLFSIPGDITHSESQGTNTLIKKGEAKCVTESLDILEEYDVLIKRSAHKTQIPLLDTLESQIYEKISREECDIDTIAQELGKTSSDISMKLSLLELKKCIKKNISGKYTLL